MSCDNHSSSESTRLKSALHTDCLVRVSGKVGRSPPSKQPIAFYLQYAVRCGSATNTIVICWLLKCIDVWGCTEYNYEYMQAQGLNSELLLHKRLHSASVRDDAPDDM